jgi:hypothetical protein
VYMNKARRLAKLNRIFEEFGVAELILQEEDIDDMISTLYAARNQIIAERHNHAVIAFISDRQANSHTYQDLRVIRLKILLGWETDTVINDYSTKYSTEELEKEQRAFHDAIRLL